MKKKLTSVLLFLAMSVGVVSAQTSKVTGKVIGEDGEPVIGASIIVKGTTVGTVTDFDGNFTLDVPANGKQLVISYIGMKAKEVMVAPNVNVTLAADTQNLDEVVITGYGVTRKAAFTGASQVVDSKILTRTTDADPVKALQGSVAGFQMSAETGQPGGFNSVKIRGLGSFNSGTQPLYVVDGVPVTSGKMGMRKDEDATINPLATLNPNDIESISVLKDATATSIYGARAANGVIVITTKKGKSGATKFNFSTKLGASMLPKRNDYRMLNAEDWVSFQTELLGNSEFISKGNREEALAFIQSEDGLGLAYDPNANTDWYDEVTRSGFTQEYNLDVSGGNDKLKFFISGGYYDELGTVIGKDMKRYSGRLNIENQVNKYIKIGLNATASYSDMNNGAGGGYFSDPITQAYMQLPVQPVKDADGEWNFNTVNGYNPVAQRSERGDRNRSKQYKAIVSPWLSATFKDFTFTSRYGMDYLNIKEFGLWSKMQPQGSDMNMMGEEGNIYTTMWTWTNTLNYIHAFGNHHLNVMIGQEAQKATEENAYLAGSNYPSDVVITVENAAKPSSASTSLRNYALASFFANAEYDYNDKYYLSGSIRRDGSSRFGANNKWATFWSVGAKYRFFTEEFMQPTSAWLTNGTLRASYGTTGNQELDEWYQALGLYGFGYNYQNRPGMVPTQIANPNLRWESTAKFNVGVELGFFNRVSLDVDYYINRTTDMLFEVPLSRVTGFESIMQNVGEMKNSGVELTLNYNPISTQHFRWDMSLNLTHNKNEIVKLSTDKPIETTTTIREAGRPYNTFKMVEYAGVNPETGAQMWYKGTEGTETTENYNEAGKRYMGCADPKVYGGFSNSFRLYDFDLSFQFNYSFGGKLYNSAARYDENTDNPFGNTTQYVFDNMWRQPGDQTDVPAPVYGNITSHSSRYLMNGSYIKLKTLQFGYNLPGELVRQAHLGSVRIYVTGDNLLTWTLGKDFRGIDPETGSDGVIWWNYPVSRKLMFGLNVSF